jgi:hypothetical protein
MRHKSRFKAAIVLGTVLLTLVTGCKNYPYIEDKYRESENSYIITCRYGEDTRAKIRISYEDYKKVRIGDSC